MICHILIKRNMFMKIPSINLPEIGNKKIQCLCLFVTILLTYFKTIHFDFNLDDYIIIDTLAGKVNGINDLVSILKLPYNNTDYRPIVLLSYGIEQFLFDEIQPAISHSINVVLYFLICISALKLFSLLFDSKYNLLLFTAVVLFCVHPLNTEVVCSLKCRDNLLSMLFGLNATIFFMLFLQQTNFKILYILATVLFSFIALLSKMDAIGFLLFMVAYLLIYKSKKKIVYVLISFVLVIVIMNVIGSIPKMVFEEPVSEALKGKVTYTENPLALYFTMVNRCIAFINTVFIYFTKMLPISGFRYYYGYNYYSILSANSVSFFGGILLIVFFISFLIFAIIKQHKTVTLSIVGIFLCSLYALNFIVPVAGIVADRYVFISNLFFCLFIVSLLQLIFSYFNKIELTKYAFIFIGIIFCVMSFARIPAWKNFKTLIDTDAPKLQHSYEAMRIAASIYMKEYENTNDEQEKKVYQEKCIFYAKKGIEVYPKNYLLHQFLGQYYFKFNQINEAKNHLNISLKNDTAKTSNFYLADIYYFSKNLDSALYFYKAALVQKPSSQVIINNISTIYYEMNDKENCLKFNNDLLAKDSTIFAAQENLGYFYLNNNDTIKAIDYFKKAIKYGLDANSLPIKIQ